MISRAAQKKLLHDLIPDVRDHYKCIAAWGFKLGRISLKDALVLSGFRRQDDLEDFSKAKPVEFTWADKARMIKAEKGKHPNFKEWVRKELNMDPSYVIRMLKADREFGGSPVEAVSLTRVFRMFYLSNDNKRMIRNEGKVLINETYYTVDNLSSMHHVDFLKLIPKPNNTGISEKRL